MDIERKKALENGSVMMNGKKVPAELPDIDEAMLIIKRMQEELDGYYEQVEREVRLRTEHLMRKVDLLEACNANLCDKFEVAQKEILALRQQVAQVSLQIDPGQKIRLIQLYGADKQPQQLAGLGNTGKRAGHVASP